MVWNWLQVALLIWPQHNGMADDRDNGAGCPAQDPTGVPNEHEMHCVLDFIEEHYCFAVKERVIDFEIALCLVPPRLRDPLQPSIRQWSAGRGRASQESSVLIEGRHANGRGRLRSAPDSGMRVGVRGTEAEHYSGLPLPGGLAYDGRVRGGGDMRMSEDPHVLHPMGGVAP